MSIESTGATPINPRSAAAAPPQRDPRAGGTGRPGDTGDAGATGRHARLAEAFGRSLGVPARASDAGAGQANGGSSDVDEALAHFTHAVVQDLRQMAAAGGAGPARSFEAFDLPANLAGLAGLADQAAAPVAVEPPMPELPNPVTPASATVHLMRVPSSHLLEAFRELSAALPGVVDPAARGEREQIASTLRRLAGAVAPQAGLPQSGLVLDVLA